MHFHKELSEVTDAAALEAFLARLERTVFPRTAWDTDGTAAVVLLNMLTAYLWEFVQDHDQTPEMLGQLLLMSKPTGSNETGPSDLDVLLGQVPRETYTHTLYEVYTLAPAVTRRNGAFILAYALAHAFLDGDAPMDPAAGKEPASSDPGQNEDERDEGCIRRQGAA